MPLPFTLQHTLQFYRTMTTIVAKKLKLALDELVPRYQSPWLTRTFTMFMKFVNTIHQNVSLLGLPIEIVGADLEHCHGLLVFLGPKGGRSESIPISWSIIVSHFTCNMPEVLLFCDCLKSENYESLVSKGAGLKLIPPSQWGVFSQCFGTHFYQ